MIECVGRGQGNIERSKDGIEGKEGGGTELVMQEDVLHTCNDSLF